jgi:hypothetical protein
MTVDEIIREIQALSIEERSEIFVWVQARVGNEKSAPASYELNGIRYVKLEAARPITKQIFDEHDELFRRLAK